MARRVHLLTGWFESAVPARQAEFQVALRSNLNNPYIDRVHLLVEARANSSLAFLGSLPHKLVVVEVARQPYYSDLF